MIRNLSESKSFVGRVIDELFNEKRVGLIATMYAPECRGSCPDGVFWDRNGFGDLFERYATAFPDFRLEIKYMIAEEDRVVAGYSFVGTNTGSFAGFPPSGCKLSVPGVMIIRLAGLKIVEQCLIWDSLGPLRQILLAGVGVGLTIARVGSLP